MLRWGVRLIPLVAIVAGVLLVTLSVHLNPPSESVQFLDSPAAIATMPPLKATMTPLPCPANMATHHVSESVAWAWFSFADDDQRVTLLTGDVITLSSSQVTRAPAISQASPLCQLGAPHGLETEYAATKPGQALVSFAGSDGSTTIDQFVVIKRPSAVQLSAGNTAHDLGVVLLLLGFAAAAALGIIGIIRVSGADTTAVPPGLRRVGQDVDDEYPSPEAYSDVAFDIFPKAAHPTPFGYISRKSREPFPPPPSWVTGPNHDAKVGDWRTSKGQWKEDANIWPGLPLPLAVRWILFTGYIVALVVIAGFAGKWYGVLGYVGVLGIVLLGQVIVWAIRKRRSSSLGPSQKK